MVLQLCGRVCRRLSFEKPYSYRNGVFCFIKMFSDILELLESNLTIFRNQFFPLYQNIVESGR
jgi:hypothetical protein